jgi:hypothetical protein
LPTRHRFSDFHQTEFGPEEALMEVPGRPRYALYSPIAVDEEFTWPGDSGSLLMNRRQFALGLVAGEFGGQALFQPLETVVELFKESRPDLSLWSPS